MKIISSPLIQKDFFIVNSNFQFIESKEDSVNVNELFANYELDFDFAHKFQKNNQIYVFVKISINSIDEPLSGYKMFVEGVSIFELDEGKKLNAQEKQDLTHLSGLSIAINNLRSYVNNLTMYFPFGKYVIPTIDLNAAFSSKVEEQKNNKK